MLDRTGALPRSCEGHWFYSGDRKYLRGFSDWNLRLDELNPLVSVVATGLPGEKAFLSAEWREEVMWKVRCWGPGFALAAATCEEKPEKLVLASYQYDDICGAYWLSL